MAISKKSGYEITNEPYEMTTLIPEEDYPTQDATDNTVNFGMGSDTNIQSGSSLGTLFGKIKYLISSLKRVAFTGDYEDLINKPEVITPEIDATATVSNTVGVPSVEVTKTGQGTENILFSFAFQNLKGNPGVNGTDGADGADGVGIRTILFKETDLNGNYVYTVTLTNNTTYDITCPIGPQGVQGVPGTKGATGNPGVGILSITYKETDLQGNYIYTVELTDNTSYDITAPRGPIGPAGQDGATGPAGPGVATGGTTGQVLVKKSNTDYDTEWQDPHTGTVDYTDLLNKPSINNVTLTGNKSLSELGIEDEIIQVTQAQYDAMEQGGTLDPTKTYFISDAAAGNVLGTAASKNYTDRLTPDSTDLPEARAVYNAISQTISGIFTPKGSIDFADLTSDLLIPANVGNVYETNDAGVTNSDWVQAAGTTIPAQSAVAIISADRIRFNYNGPAVFNLNDYQTKDLQVTTQGASTVEGALTNLASQKVEQSALTTLINNIKTITALVNTTINSTSYKSITLGDYSVYLVIVASANSVAIQNLCYKSQGSVKLGYINPTTSGMGSIQLDFTNSRVRGVDLTSYDLQYGVHLYIYGII